MAEYITELANDIAKSCPDLVENGCGNDNCVACLAFKLIGLGYKKQDNTADVVPNSEVERLSAVMKEMDEQRAYTINMLGESLEAAKSEIEMLQGALKAEERHNELTMEMAQKALKNAKSEVAREIFEEIDKSLCKNKFQGVSCFLNDLTELKKKYTEGHNEQEKGKRE